MKLLLGTCDLESDAHVKSCGCVNWRPLPPKPKWWSKMLDGLGNAVSESLFGGSNR